MRAARELGLDLIVHVNRDGLARGINPITSGSELHTDVMKTQALRQALDRHRFDLAFGGARRDEEKSRAKERVFSFRNAHHVWDPKRQRPEPWRIYNGRKRRGESIRVFPLSNWTELDVWLYIHQERIPVVPLYFAAPRPVVVRDGALIMVDDDRLPLRAGRAPADQDGALSHARLLSADRRDREHRAHRSRGHSTKPSKAPTRSGAAASSTATARRRWNGKSRKAISDERAFRSRRAYGFGSFLQQQERKSLLRFVACGSVDHGKSTLIGRLLYESKQLFEDQLDALAADFAQIRHARRGARFCAAGRRARRRARAEHHHRRRLPLLRDARGANSSSSTRRGTNNTPPTWRPAPRSPIWRWCWSAPTKALTRQTKRHVVILSMLGVRKIVLAVNKMDRVGWSQEAFRAHRGAIPRLGQGYRRRRYRLHSARGQERRQCRQPLAAYALVPRADAARPSGTGGARADVGSAIAADADPMGQPARCGFSRL